MTAPGPTRVYAAHGKLAHLLRPGDVPVSGDAFCRPAPALYGWRGTGSQLEYEIAAALPLCSRCEYLSAESPDLPGAARSAAPGTDVPAPDFLGGLPARAPRIPGAGHHHPPAPGTVPAVTATPPLAVTAARPANPVPPSGEAEGAHNGTAPRGPGAQAALSPSPTPGDRAAPVPPPGARGPVAPGGGSTGLSGKAAMDAVRAAQAGLAKAARGRRGKPKAKPGYQPGGNRRQP